MKAVILAAGSARRMMPLSRSTHKTLLEIGGRRIIDRILDGLFDNAIRDVVLVTGYRADELEGHVMREFPDICFEFVRNENYDNTNNIQSLALALESIDIDDDVLLLESDLIYEAAVLRKVIESPHDNVAAVDRYQLGLDGTVVALSDGGVISEVIPSSMQGPSFSFVDKYKTLNIYKFSQRFCNETFKGLLSYYSRTIDNDCYYELILGVLIYMRQVKIHAEVLAGERWAEVDDPNDLRGAEFVFSPEKRSDLLDSSWGGYWNTPITDFAFIRNMHFPPDSMVSQLKEQLPNLAENYGSAQWLLDEKLANFLHCSSAHVKFLNGASQFFPVLRDMFSSDRVLLPKPTFGEYTRIFRGARTYSDSGEFSVERVVAEMADSDLIVVVNPNNPTGTTAKLAELQTLVENAGNRTVLIDESFLDFSDESSIVPWLEDRPRDNVIVLKSLSKVLGVPGLRIGFVYSTNAEVQSRVAEQLPVWNVNSVAEHFVELLLKYPRDLKLSFELTRRDRDVLSTDLSALPVVKNVFPSGANFLLVQMHLSAAQSEGVVSRLLLDDGIYIKDVSKKFVDGGVYWRLAVRSSGENRALCSRLGEVHESLLIAADL